MDLKLLKEILKGGIHPFTIMLFLSVLVAVFFHDSTFLLLVTGAIIGYTLGVSYTLAALETMQEKALESMGGEINGICEDNT